MAFDFKWLTRVNQTISPFKNQNPAEGQATGGPTMWMYNASSTGSNETAATVEGANYFLGASGFLGVGDWIICDTNDPNYVILNVTAVTAGTTVTTAVYEPSGGGTGTFTTVSVGNGTAAAPSYTFTSDTNTGIYRVGSHDIGISANGSKVVDIATTGMAVTGTLSATTTISAGTNLSAGSSGTAGTVTSFPASAANGKIVLAAVNNSGNKTATVSNKSTLAQDTVYTLADPGAATGTIPVSGTVSTIKMVSKATVAGGAAAQTVTDAAVSATSVVIANWNDTTTPCEIETVAPGNGNFVVTSTADPGASHISYVVYN